MNPLADGTSPTPSPEAEELGRVLASETFSRAPTLSRVLAYICEKQFRGESSHVNEYNIAVEALCRPPDFDPQSDAIVRVDIHQLRKRLQQYYATLGADHPIQIVVPPGQYVPQFVHVQRPIEMPIRTEQGSQTADEPSGAEWPVESPESRKKLGAYRKVLILCGSALAAAGLLLWSFRPTVNKNLEPVPAELKPANPAMAAITSPDGAIRIMCGSQVDSYADKLGRIWHGDRFFSGGAPGTRTGTYVFRTQEPAVFENWRSGEFQYDIPLSPGTYQLHLYFTEMKYGEGNSDGGGEGMRAMTVTVNDVPVLTNFDVLADAGAPNVGDVKVFKDIRPGSDGMLHLRLSDTSSRAVLNGIEILPGIPGKMRPVRICTQERPFRDSSGRVWEPDRYFFGGRKNFLPMGKVTGTADPQLYSTQRYGHFNYVIPLAAKGKYRLTLHFTENWFGPNNPGSLGTGARVFDVFCNGVALLRDLDVLKEAGRENRPVVKVFSGLSANAQDKLIINFVPRVNYASLCALEVTDESL